jgi:hypothetical protein
VGDLERDVAEAGLREAVGDARDELVVEEWIPL